MPMEVLAQQGIIRLPKLTRTHYTQYVEPAIHLLIYSVTEIFIEFLLRTRYHFCLLNNFTLLCTQRKPNWFKSSMIDLNVLIRHWSLRARNSSTSLWKPRVCLLGTFEKDFLAFKRNCTRRWEELFRVISFKGQFVLSIVPVISNLDVAIKAFLT